MAGTFDPYYRWLSIPPSEQPPNHYRLLGVALFEPDEEVISEAAERQMLHVKLHASGPHSALSQKLLNELARAKLCLLDPTKRAAYDQALHARLNRADSTASPAAALAPPQPPRATPPEGIAAGPPRPQPVAAVARPQPAPRATPAAGLPPQSAAVVRSSPVQAQLKRRSQKQRQQMLVAGGLVTALLLGAYLFWPAGSAPPDTIPAETVASSSLTPPEPEPGANTSTHEEIAPQAPRAAAADSSPATAPSRAEPESSATAEPPYTLSRAELEALAPLLSKIHTSLARKAFAYSPTAGEPAGQRVDSAREGPIVGLRVELRETSGERWIDKFVPINLQSDGTVPAEFTPPDADEVVHVYAKPGYALGGLHLSRDSRFRGGSAVFMRMTSDGLDSEDRDFSPWFGDRGQRTTRVLSPGRAIVALRSFHRDGLRGVSFVYPITSPLDVAQQTPQPQQAIPTPTIRPATPGANVGTSAASSPTDDPSPEDWYDLSQAQSRQLVTLVPQPGVTLTGTVTACYQKGELLTGLRISINPASGAVCGVQALFQRGLASNPIGRMLPTSTSEVRARPGYAVINLFTPREAKDEIEALRLRFARITPTGLDAQDTYESNWYGTFTQTGISRLDQTRLIVGIFGAGATEITALGVVTSINHEKVPGLVLQADGALPGATPSGVLADLVGGVARKQPVPNEEAQAKARATIDEIYGEDQQQAKTDAAVRTRLMHNLYQQALQSANDPAAQYVLLDLARDCAMRGDDYATAWQILQDLQQRFEVSVLEQKEEVLLGGSQHAQQPVHYRTAAEKWRELGEEALGEYDFELAERCASRALQAARRARDVDFRKQIETWQSQIEQRKPRFEQALAARDALKKNPDDKVAARQLGLFLCGEQQKWSEGLPHLAKSDRPKLARVAQLDLQLPRDGQAQYELAEQWWDLSEQAEKDSPDQVLFQQRAAHWYQYALPSLAGLSQIKAEKRIHDALAAANGGSGWVDLLSLVDVNRHGGGPWQRAGDAVNSLPGGTGYNSLTIPVRVASSYQMRFTFMLRRAQNYSGARLYMALPVGDHSCVLVLSTSSSSGISYINGNSYSSSSNPTYVSPSGLQENTPYQAHVRVELVGDQARIGVTINGRPYLAWQGSQQQLASASGYGLSSGMLGFSTYYYSLLSLRDVRLLASGGYQRLE